MSALLEVEDLSKSFGRFQALDAMSFRVLRSDVIAIIGPNGAGKSTCLDVINGQLKPDGGRVLLHDRDVTGLSPREMWRRGVGRTFQIPAVFASMTVAENVQMSILAAEGRLGMLGGRAASLYREDAAELLELLHIADEADRVCGELSYGTLKRVEVAIALAHNPKLLLMDEPSAGMRPADRVEFMDHCAELALREGVALVFTEHDMDVVFHCAGRIIVLDHGQVIAEGGPADVRDDERVREVYLGYDLSHLDAGHAPRI